MHTSPPLRRLALVAALAFIPVAAGVALATPSLGLTPTIVARGTSAEEFSVKGAPHRAKVRRSRAIIACGLDRQCDFVFQTITFQPGGHTGWHSHPGVLFVTVESGAVTRYEHFDVDERDDDDDDDEDDVAATRYQRNCVRNTYAGGQSFIERGPQHVILVRNEGSTPAKVQIAYVVPAGTENAALRIDQPAPEGCPPTQ
jgi:hypothetical protein